MKIERTKNASRNIFFGAILKIYQILIPFVMRTAMIYLMGVQYLGLSSLFSSVLQVLNLAELGVGAAMVFSMYKPIAEDDHTTICALMKLYRIYYRVIGLVIACIGLILTPFIPRLISGDVPAGINIYALYLINLGATVSSYWLFAYKNSILQAHQRSDIVSKVCLATNTIQYGVQFFVLWVIKDYYVYVLVALFTQMLTNVVTAYAANKLYPQFKPKGQLDREEVKKINRRIRDLFTAKVGSVVFNSVDTIVISAFLGLASLAVYQNYYYILSSVGGFITILYSSITAGMGNSFVVETKEKNYSLFCRLSFIINWVVCICCCCFAALYQPFMQLWVGTKLMLGDYFVFLFIVYFYCTQIRQLWCTVKDAAGIWHKDRFRPLCSSAVNLILNIVLVRKIGLPGILISSIISCMCIGWPWLLTNIFSTVYKVRPFKYFLNLFLWGITIAGAVFATTIVCEYISISGILGLLVYGVIAVIISNLFWIGIWHRSKWFGESILYLKEMCPDRFRRK